MRRFYRLSPRALLRDVPMAILLGAGIGVLLWIGDRETEPWPMILFSVWIGLVVYLLVTVLLSIVSPLLSRLSSWRLYALLVPLMFVGSAFGFFVAIQTLPLLDPLWRLLFGETPSWMMMAFALPGWGPLLSFAGVLGALTGLAFFRYERLKDRLSKSIEQLKERELAERELETARKIQRRILGPKRLEGEGYRIAAENKPALYVAGDFYDVFPRTDGALGLVAADVSGKGMGASLVMASVKGRLPLLAESHGVAETLSALNRQLVSELDRREFVALCHVRYEPVSGEFELANAGLPDPYVLAADREPRPVAVSGPRLPLGMRTEIEYRSISGRLEPGARLLLITDGLPEAPRSDGSPLGYPGLEQLLREGDGPPAEWLPSLFERIERQLGSERDDDWTALLIERVK